MTGWRGTSTSPQGLRLPFSVLAKPTGAVCNLDCTYCFFLSKEALYDGRPQLMDDQGLQDYLGNLFDSQPDGPVEVSWQGGEPTMRGLDFFRRAVDLAEALRRPRQTVSFALQTNGTLLDDEWGAFLAEHHVLVGLSIDGPAPMHDAYRVNKAGRGSHAQVVRGWRLLQRHQVDTNVLCTIHSANADHPLEVYRYLRDELGARYLQFIPIVERTSAEGLDLADQGWRGVDGRRVLYRQVGDAVTGRSVTAEAYGAFMTEIFDEWLAHDVGTVFVQDIDVALGNLLGRHTLCVSSPQCGSALVVEHNGDVYSCDHYVEPGYKLGNVAEVPLQVMLRSPQQVDFGNAKSATLPTQCRECPVLWACHGGCPKDRIATTADGQPGVNHLCSGYRRFYGHAEPTLRRIAELVVNGRPAADISAGVGTSRLPARATADDHT